MSDPDAIVSPQSITPIFDLTGAQLWPILEAAIEGERIREVRIAIERQVEGYFGGCGDKLIPTIAYTTHSGLSGEITLFVKRFSWKGCSEAIHYRHLAERGTPAPRLYGTLMSPDQEEILFLEYLPSIGMDKRSVEDWRTLLTLIARFAAAPLSAEYQVLLPTSELSSYLRSEDTKADIVVCLDRAKQGELGADLAAFCQDSEALTTRVLERVGRLNRQIEQMPVGLIHQDFLPDNLGWRGERQEMLVFDIHKNALGPRFYDLTRWFGKTILTIGPSSWLDGSEGLRQELTEHFLQEYARWGGAVVTVADFQEEIRLLSLASSVEMLWWLRDRAHDGLVEWKNDPEEARKETRAHLLRLLHQLAD